MYKPVLGIIGGGQLGSMLSQAAKKLDFRTVIYCDDQDAPAQIYSDEFIFGDYNDKIKLQEFINKVDCILTPNIPEAEILTKTKINSKEDMIYAANILLNLGAKNKSLEIEQMRLKNFRNNVVISFFGIVIIALLVF